MPNSPEKEYYEIEDLKTQEKYRAEKSFDPTYYRKDILNFTEEEFVSYFKNRVAYQLKGLNSASTQGRNFTLHCLAFFFLIGVACLFGLTKVHLLRPENQSGMKFALIFFGCWFTLVPLYGLFFTFTTYRTWGIGILKYFVFENTDIKYIPYKNRRLEPAEAMSLFKTLMPIAKRFSRNFSTLDEFFSFKYNGMPIRIWELYHYKTEGAIFIETKINKKLEQEIFVKSKEGLSLSNLKNKDIVSLEDPLFNISFDTYADNQIEARYILTPSFMTRLLNYKKSHDCKVDVIVSNKIKEDANIFLYISTKKDWFSCSIEKDFIDNPRPFYSILQEIKQIADVVDALKLDQDIGM